MMDIVGLILQSVGLTTRDADTNVSMHEDNTISLVLADTLLPKLTLWGKYYATKTSWFHGDIFKRVINLVNIDTHQQLVYFLRKDCLTQHSDTSKINLLVG